MIRLGVTGTDTGVGKTTIACALLALLREAGARTAVMKPVETGVGGDDPTSDAERLRVMATERHPLQRVRPYALPEPIAPLRRRSMPASRSTSRSWIAHSRSSARQRMR